MVDRRDGPSWLRDDDDVYVGPYVLLLCMYGTYETTHSVPVAASMPMSLHIVNECPLTKFPGWASGASLCDTEDSIAWLDKLSIC